MSFNVSRAPNWVEGDSAEDEGAEGLPVLVALPAPLPQLELKPLVTKVVNLASSIPSCAWVPAVAVLRRWRDMGLGVGRGPAVEDAGSSSWCSMGTIVQRSQLCARAMQFSILGAACSSSSCPIRQQVCLPPAALLPAGLPCVIHLLHGQIVWCRCQLGILGIPGIQQTKCHAAGGRQIQGSWCHRSVRVPLLDACCAVARW